jgi:hypothetical protein
VAGHEGRRLDWLEAPILLGADGARTDKDWVRHGASAFGWLAPGELRLFEPSERDEARRWLGTTESA